MIDRRIIIAALALLPSLALADCVPGNVVPPVNDSTYCCSGAFEAGGSGRCAALPTCLPGGSPASLSNPGQCCSLTVLNNGGSPICQSINTCFQGGHPANLANPGACCSLTALNNGGNPVCAATNSNAYAVGSVFIDLNHDKQQGAGEVGSDFSRNAVLTVYAINASNRVAGRGSVAPDGYWRIDSGVLPATGYTFVLSDLPGVGVGIQSPPSIMPPHVTRTGENTSSSYQSPGTVDPIVDSRIAGIPTQGSVVGPPSYMNFGLVDDRIFASGFD